MSTAQERNEPDPSRADRWARIIVATFLIAFLCLLDALSWLTERGGVFSLFGAASLVRAKAPAIDVDESALRLPILLIVWLVAGSASRLFRLRLVDLSSRPSALVFLLIVIGGGFALTAVYGEAFITRYMSGHGYSRCIAADHAHGNGKSRVWFANYVLQPDSCRSSIQPR